MDQIQEMATEDARKTYSDIVIDHATNPRNLGGMDNADGFARITGPCGDTMEIWLRVKDNTIVEIKFMTDGCGTTLATGSMVTELTRAKTTVQALQISQQNFLDALGGLPDESKHCALLAANTLNAAIRNYLALKNEPWKKAYRRY
ncbi:iron-sulfur cluster assembly scaffold protein [Chloroflexota bacterium]